MHSISEQFHELYYESRVWRNTFWLGVETLKCPLDLWIYQELLQEVRPRYIIETGTAAGGSALFLASVCDLLGTGEIITVDIEERPARPAHARIEYLKGSSVAVDTVRAIKERVGVAAPVLAILDSDHSQQHVSQELQIYGAMVTEGSYLIVEDTNVNGHPVLQHHGAGPMEAVESFLRETPQFTPDREREKFFLTFNPKGYLRKIKG
ncbi:MAG TPA: CmcI family methyltransferase [Pyrinomonadaceae bacterium]|jgi:cephalosporin hydroxylase